MVDFDYDNNINLDNLIEDVRDDIQKSRGQAKKAHLKEILGCLLELKILRSRFNIVLDNYTCLLNAIKVKML